MSPLMTTIANGTTQILETPALIAASIAAAMVSTAQPRAPTPKRVKIDSRTLADIGVERGSITWMR